MQSILMTYSLNPLVGLKLLVKSADDISWSTLWSQALPAIAKKLVTRDPDVQISVGSLTPEGVDHLSKIEQLGRLKFFIAIDTQGDDQAYPALPSGKKTAIQVYQHEQGSYRYKAQVVRFNLGNGQIQY